MSHLFQPIYVNLVIYHINSTKQMIQFMKMFITYFFIFLLLCSLWSTILIHLHLKNTCP
jgi:hypothetical protein